MSDRIKFKERFKAKAGRYYKIFRARLIKYVTLRNSSQRNFFKATIYSLPEFLGRVSRESGSNLQKDELRELLEISPLFLWNVSITKQKWIIGKIENHPFDVIIAPENSVITRMGADRKREFGFHRGLFIQAKRLYKYPGKVITFREWLDALQSLIEEKIATVDFGSRGHIHIYNQMVYENPNIHTLNEALKKMHVPYNKYIDSISLAIEMVNPKGETSVGMWFIYPLVRGPISAIDLDIEKAKRVYSDDPIVMGMTKALVMPRGRNGNSVR